MPDQTLEAPPPVQVPVAAPRRRPRVRRPGRAAGFVRSRWLLAAAGLLAFSLLVVLWARTRPGYDPYGWLVWGKLSVHLKLDTNGAPSWKPLPFVFTVPYALFGRYALWLWMVTSVAISLSGPIFAWRIAFRLTGADPARRYASYVAGLFAAMSVLLMEDPVGRFSYIHYVLSAESDTMIVSLCLMAIDLHLSEHHRAAFWIWWLGALGRPEVWPFWALAGVWLWRSNPAYRRWLLSSAVLLGFLWFGVPGLTSKSFLTAGNVAENSPRQLHGNRISGTLARFHELQATTVWVASALMLALATYRRQLAILVIAGGAAVWVLIEIGFALHGFPAVPRYMFEPGAVVAVLAGVFVGRLILELPPLLAAVARRVRVAGIGPRLAMQLGAWGTGLAVLAVAGSMLGPAGSQYRLERADLTSQRHRTVLIDRLSTVVQSLGAGRILACGQPHIPIAYQSILAWYMNIKIGELYVSRVHERTHPHPLVNIYPVSGLGWKVFPSHLSAASAGRCQGLNLVVYR